MTDIIERAESFCAHSDSFPKSELLQRIEAAQSLIPELVAALKAERAENERLLSGRVLRDARTDPMWLDQFETDQILGRR